MSSLDTKSLREFVNQLVDFFTVQSDMSTK